MLVISRLLQLIIALVFLQSGYEKLKGFKKQKQKPQVKPASLLQSPGFFNFLGVCEYLGAWGLIIPDWFGFWPVLMILAAIGLLIIMCGAFVFHFKAHESSHTAFVSSIIIILIFIIILRSIIDF